MSKSNWQDEVTPALRRLQVIVGAIIVGCLAFLATVLVVAAPPDVNRQPLITYVALGFAAMAIVSRLVFVGVVVAMEGSKRIRGRESFRQRLRPDDMLNAQRCVGVAREKHVAVEK